MKLTTKLASLSLVAGACLMPLSAQAGNNQMQQMVFMNNVNGQEQKISSQISTYVSTGQLSPAQGAAFSSELSQISGQAMMGANPAQEMGVMNELNGLSAQIGGSLQVPVQYAQPTTVYTNAAPGYYNNWRNRLAHEQHTLAEERQIQLNQEHSALRQINQQHNFDNAVRHDNLLEVQGQQRYNNEINNLKTAEEKAEYKRTHPNYTGH